MREPVIFVISIRPTFPRKVKMKLFPNTSEPLARKIIFVWRRCVGRRLIAVRAWNDLVDGLVYGGDYNPEQWPAGTPPGIAQLLDRALAREPAERFGSAGALAAELSKLTEPARARLNAQPLPAAQPQPAEPVG